MIEGVIRQWANGQWVEDPNLEMQVERLSWAALGGPERAVALYTGAPGRLEGLLQRVGDEWLALEDGQPVWWGRIEAVSVQTGVWGRRVSAAGLANRLRVSYTRVQAGGICSGEDASTPWAEDLASQAAYGCREAVVAGGEASDGLALQMAQQALARRAAPALSLLHETPDGCWARVEAAGWWSALEDRLAVSLPLTEGLSLGAGSISLGRVRQSLRLAGGEGWRAAELRLYARRAGSPPDELRATLTDEAGVELAMAAVAGEALPPALAWVTLPLPVPVFLRAGQTYLLRVERSAPGAAGEIGLGIDDEARYERGSLALWAGDRWMECSPAADLTFELRGVLESTELAARLARRADARVLRGVEINTPSGVDAAPWFSGQTSTRAEIERLLSAGTADGARLLAEVTSERWLRMFRAPAAGDGDLMLNPAGDWAEQNGQTSSLCRPPYRCWASWGAGLPPVWLEKAEWRAGRWAWNPGAAAAAQKMIGGQD